ncbi:MAG: hypothetical protein H6534_05975 [Chthonomonadaceae bacterium]|nr:hypothetical protein [Chthonomonadaceae bacterium]
MPDGGIDLNVPRTASQRYCGVCGAALARVTPAPLPLLVALALPQAKPTPQGEAILQRIIAVRELPAEKRPTAITDIAKTISAKTTGSERVTLASLLVGSSSEGDDGNRTLQLAADTLIEALKETPASGHSVGTGHAILAIGTERSSRPWESISWEHMPWWKESRRARLAR